MKTIVIGIDAATVHEKCGYAIGELTDDAVHVRNAGTLKSKHCPDALDACLCALAASDFLAGATWEPEDPKVAHKEGWIWFARGGLSVTSDGNN